MPMTVHQKKNMEDYTPITHNYSIT